MLTATSEHALRALAHLAKLPEGASITGRELAERAGIPANYLSKILWTLGNAGIIDATRGSHGGYRLKRAAAEIHLIDVVELFDRGRDRLASFHDVRAAYLDFLRTKTVADISHMERPNAGM
jgi:Rrf2 family protein